MAVTVGTLSTSQAGLPSWGWTGGDVRELPAVKGPSLQRLESWLARAHIDGNGRPPFPNTRKGPVLLTNKTTEDLTQPASSQSGSPPLLT